MVSHYCTPAPFRLGQWLAEPGLDQVTGLGQTHKLEPRSMRLLCVLTQAGGTVSGSPGNTVTGRRAWPALDCGIAVSCLRPARFVVVPARALDQCADYRDVASARCRDGGERHLADARRQHGPAAEDRAAAIASVPQPATATSGVSSRRLARRAKPRSSNVTRR